MARLEDLSPADRLFVRTYPWRTNDPVPWAVPDKRVDRSRVAVVSSAGLVLPGQEPFDPAVRGGDWSYRVIRREADLQSLTDTHRSRSFDHRGVAEDPNLAFPLERLRELAERGRVGEVAPRHLSFMGSILAPGRLIRESAPEAAAMLVEDRVDVALLVPV